MDNFRKVNLGICVVAGLCFLVSFFTSAVLKQEACLLCLVTRFCFLGLSLVAFCGGKFLKEYVVCCASFIVMLVAFYHLGVENHWWASPEVCRVPLPTLDSMLTQKDLAAPPRCDEVVMTVFGVSMTLLSFLASAFLFWISSLLVVAKKCK